MRPQTCAPQTAPCTRCTHEPLAETVEGPAGSSPVQPAHHKGGRGAGIAHTPPDVARPPVTPEMTKDLLHPCSHKGLGPRPRPDARGPGALGTLLKLSVPSYGLDRVLLPSNSHVAAQAPPVGGLWR